MTDEQNQEGLQEVALLTFANDKSEENLNLLRGLLKMVYHTVMTNRLAIMSAKDAETGKEELILVGVEQNGDGINCYPLFLPIRGEDVAKYLAPDGSGGWLGEEVTDESVVTE